MTTTFDYSPTSWLNRLAAVYPELSDVLLDGLPSDESSLMGELTKRFESFDLALGNSRFPAVSLLRSDDIRVARTLLGSLKKFRGTVEGASSDLEAEAITRYECNNFRARSHQIPWQYRDAMRRFLSDILSEYGKVDVPGRFGPGAVEEGYSTVYRWRWLFGQREETLGFRAVDPGYLGGSRWGVGTVKYESVQFDRRECACRLCAVPKDWNKLRLITVEPTANTYLQAYTRERIRLAWASKSRLPKDFRALAEPLRINPQVRHQKLALAGSVDGSLATLDLSDASDSISLDQVAAVMPSEVMADLLRSRTEYYYSAASSGLPTMPNEGREIFMYGGMGNGTTFVVETMMFHAASHAIAEHFGVPSRERRISVYGDDIICSPRLARLLVAEFPKFGWEINKLKSYYDEASRFRESCGIQAYMGQDVTLLRFSGGKTGDEALISQVDLLRRCCLYREFTKLAAERWPELAHLPNSTTHTAPGSLLLSNPWWPDSTSSLKKRFNRSVQKMQWSLPRPVHSSVTCPSTGVGLVYGALSGQLSGITQSSSPDLFARTGKNRVSGTVRLPLREWSGIQNRWTDVYAEGPWYPDNTGNTDDRPSMAVVGEQTGLSWEASASGAHSALHFAL